MKLKDKIITFWVQIRDLYLYFFRRAIIVNGYVDDYTWQGIRHRNWGDDLNYYFLRELTGRPVIFYHSFKLAKWLHLCNYMCIGSILDNYTSPCNLQTIVWGTGCVGVKWNKKIFSLPLKILSARGELTKKFLIQNGIECPEIFGDPALLLPLVYQPEMGAGDEFQVSGDKFHVSGSQYKLGIIPHVVDLQHPVIQGIRKQHPDDILIIDLAHYQKWTDVIDQICSCERILSSSLHGLIVSDAYQVPSCWIELSGKISGGYFKFYDYASSVERHFDKPVKVNSVEELDMLDVECASPQQISVLQEGLIKACPFEISGLKF